jgi:hypothetical protein
VVVLGKGVVVLIVEVVLSVVVVSAFVVVEGKGVVVLIVEVVGAIVVPPVQNGKVLCVVGP